MKHLYTTLITLLLVQGLTAQWQRQSPFPFPPFNAEEMAWANAQRGYLVGDPVDGQFAGPGRILETTDGGQSWHALSLNDLDENMDKLPARMIKMDHGFTFWVIFFYFCNIIHR